MKVSLLTTALLDLQGKEYILGGNERYLLDVIEIYRQIGFKKIEVFQPSLKDFHVIDEVNNFEVKGIGYEQVNLNTYKKINKYFHYNSQDSLINHYQSFTLGYPFVKNRSIGISHGISWDKPYGDNWDTPYSKKEKLMRNLKKEVLTKRYKKILLNMNTIVANDTNLINYARIEWPEVVKNINYIPNYVDLLEFTPSTKDEKELVILFPRRISHERGFELAYKIATKLLKINSNLTFVFTGERPDYLDIFSQNIEFVSTKFEDMNKLYNRADIVIIPTLSSEGTSLSCLEAMASGVPVIATNVGGLPNMLINNFNGILINPNYEELERALLLLIDNKEIRDRYSKNALESVKAFSKDNWNSSWSTIITSKIEGL